MELRDYPKELTKNRDSIESSFVFCLWKDPTLYDDYLKINDGKDKALLTKDGEFYFSLGKLMYEQGYRNFDNITVFSFLESRDAVKAHFEKKGGYSVVQDLVSLVNTDNVDGYFDTIIKYNTLMKLHDKGYDVIKNIDKFNQMNNQQVYDWYEYQLNDIFISTGQEFEIEDLVVTDQFIDECDQGLEMGVPYNKVCKILSSITMGIPLGELTMIGAHSGVGKSSFMFENIILPIMEGGIKCAVISNEQRSKDFKMLLIVHVLTHELGYYGLTRKHLKQGGFTAEQKEMLYEAKRIIEERYSELRFVKLFDNDMNKVKKTMKKLAKIGYQIFMFDTMKSEDEIDEAMWQQLLIHSRKLFQLASKENIGIVCSYQLALHTINRRYLDASCLSNAKQIKEVFSEMIYFRQMWDDEFEDEKFDIEPFRWSLNEDGKYERTKSSIKLDPTKKYIVAFVDKTRSDEDKQQVLYEFNGAFNRWKEVGRCTVKNQHIM